MSDERPDLLRRLLDQDATFDDASSPAGAAPANAPQRVIHLEADDPDFVPHRFTRQAPAEPGQPPQGIARFGPAYWPWPAATPGAQARNVAILALAVVGAFAGLFFTWYQLLTNPLGDAHAYFDAAVRLNHGQPLYTLVVDTPKTGDYSAPPLLAVALRPLVLFGWPVFAAIWEAIVVGSFVLLLRRLGAGTKTWLALAILALPVGWCLAIGQVQVPLTLLLAIGQPWSIALGANLNLFAALAALWWIGRRDFQATGAFVAWLLLFGLAQVVIEATGSVDFVQLLNGDEIGKLLSGSPFAAAPLPWAALVGAGIIATVLAARSRWGWLAAVTLTSLVALPLSAFRLAGLLAAVREPEIAGLEVARPPQPLRYGRR